jgi:hypothetical protein
MENTVSHLHIPATDKGHNGPARDSHINVCGRPWAAALDGLGALCHTSLVEHGRFRKFRFSAVR